MLLKSLKARLFLLLGFALGASNAHASHNVWIELDLTNFANTVVKECAKVSGKSGPQSSHVTVYYIEKVPANLVAQVQTDLTQFMQTHNVTNLVFTMDQVENLGNNTVIRDSQKTLYDLNRAVHQHVTSNMGAGQLYHGIGLAGAAAGGFRVSPFNMPDVPGGYVAHTTVVRGTAASADHLMAMNAILENYRNARADKKVFAKVTGFKVKKY